ncbi:MAG: aminotransferase class V-fold PLP-dependent enzyme [Deltaproteobacteria bacterium]|nr:aminotransferase class V-fold PLP-dependent enzyme [Deltaproteobacteria bacterium]
MNHRRPSPATRCVGGRAEVDPTTGALGTPIVMASTFHQEDPAQPGPWEYTRSGNPTRHAVETLLAELEGGTAGFAFASGMAATTAVLSLLNQGDHVVAARDLYGGTFRALTAVFSRFGIEATFADATDPDALGRAFRSNTRMVWLETPSNPLLRVTDLRACASFARERGALTVVDNTFMTPLRQRPLELGVDIVVHSATKFLGGHSDLVAGAVVVSDPDLAQQVGYLQNALGGVLSPHDSWLLARGIKTLKARYDAEEATAQELAHRLAGHPAVERVYYPGLPDHPGSGIHSAQASGPGAVLSFDVGSEEAALRVLQTVEVPAVAVSLGGVESILSYPWTMSHAAMPPARRRALGIGPGLLRLSAGLEDVEDLWADLERALGG